MPKRTNEFQRLIKRIYEQLSGPGVTVEESAMLPERADGTKREADILLTQHSLGLKIQIAVECRDGRARNDVTWIDGLIGKYIDLFIDKVVAVSRTEFTPAARSKAASHRIETLTLREALETDWTSEFTKPGFLQIDQSFIPVSGSVEALPPIEGDFEDTTLVRMGENGEQVPFKEVCRVIFEHYKPYIGQEMGKLLADGKRTIEDIPDTIGTIQFLHRFEAPVYLMHKGRAHKLLSMTILLESRFNHEDMPVDHKALGDLRISTTEMLDVNTGEVFEITAVQEKANPGEAKMSVRPKKDSKRKK